MGRMAVWALRKKTRMTPGRHVGAGVCGCLERAAREEQHGRTTGGGNHKPSLETFIQHGTQERPFSRADLSCVPDGQTASYRTTDNPNPAPRYSQ